ncbi:MAG: hypothetical protein GY868_21395 [Deltaproteobacteria bacterium]|nr:hypothetical protein [Deltaproteobacteria bacterium]
MQKNILIAAVVVVAAVVAVGGYVFIKQQSADTMPAAGREVLDQASLEQRALELEAKVAELEQELEFEMAAGAPEIDNATLAEAFGAAEVSVAGETARPETVADRVAHFFEYLDRKGYLKDHGISMGSATYFSVLVDRLDRTRPVVTGETRDLYALLKNITFFFRVLGKSDVAAVRAVLDGEDAIIEPTMELFYAWLDPWGSESERGSVKIAPEMAYEYAGFLLNTIAGQSYLFRRNSKVRCLSAYYCIRILDRANDDGLNKYGIDIRPHISTLVDEIRGYTMLAQKREYLQKLQQLRKKY